MPAKTLNLIVIRKLVDLIVLILELIKNKLSVIFVMVIDLVLDILIIYES